MPTSTPQHFTKTQTAKNYNQFWKRHPSLLIGLSIFLGCFNALSETPSLPRLFPILPFAWFLFRSGKKINWIIALCIGFGSFFWVLHSYQLPDRKALSEQGALGTAYFRIDTIQKRQQHGQSYYFLKGCCEQFIDSSGNQIARNAPCSLRLSTKPPLPSSRFLYKIESRLQSPTHNLYRLLPQSRSEWKSLEPRWSLATMRYQTKNALMNHLSQCIHNQKVRAFLTGLATGEFADKLLAMEFSRFGLQHIMAISGFHFGIVAFLVQMMIQPFFSLKKGGITCLILLSSYFLFLGSSPSIERAWIASVVVLGGIILGRGHYPLNTLGVALTVTLFLDPLQCERIGFQFSFLVTASILLLFQPIDTLFKQWLPPRKMGNLLELRRTDQHLYLIAASVRQGIALAIAVHVMAIPLTLAFFHKFPFLSLLYNLFFPFCVSLSLFLLFLGLLSAFLHLSPLTIILHSINEWYTAKLLDTVFDLPITCDFCVRCRDFPPLFLSFWICLILGLGLCKLKN